MHVLFLQNRREKLPEYSASSISTSHGKGLETRPDGRGMCQALLQPRHGRVSLTKSWNDPGYHRLAHKTPASQTGLSLEMPQSALISSPLSPISLDPIPLLGTLASLSTGQHTYCPSTAPLVLTSRKCPVLGPSDLSFPLPLHAVPTQDYNYICT